MKPYGHLGTGNPAPRNEGENEAPILGWFSSGEFWIPWLPWWWNGQSLVPRKSPSKIFKNKKTPKNGVTFPPPFLLGVRLDFIFYFTRGLVQHKNNGFLFPQVSDVWTVEPLFEDVWTERNKSKTLIRCQVTLWRPNQWTKKHWHWAQNPKVLIYEIYLPCCSITCCMLKKRGSFSPSRTFRRIPNINWWTPMKNGGTLRKQQDIFGCCRSIRNSGIRFRHVGPTRRRSNSPNGTGRSKLSGRSIRKHLKPETMDQKNMTNDGLP